MAAAQRTTIFGKIACRWIVGYLFSQSMGVLAASVGVNVALHAQVPPSADMVVGSAVTMAGVRRALLNRNYGCDGVPGGEGGHCGAEIAHAQIFYPFAYEGLHDRRWDLVIIEGWFKMINVFIHEVRALAYPGQVTVLFYCLDPQFPGLPHTSALDVDGFLTNSRSTQDFLLKSAPTALVPLAVDPEVFPFYPEPLHSARGAPSNVGASGIPRGNIVYVGAAGAMDYKDMLAWVLREAAPYGLDIYGSGWHDVPEFSANWRGVLPEGELASVYGTALAVIGVTMDAQRLSGMINNRVFEVLSVGAPLISDHFPALEAIFGDSVLYVRRPGDVARHIEHLLTSGFGEGGTEREAGARRQRRTLIEDGHTWARRVDDIMSFAESLSGNTVATGRNGERRTADCSKRGGCLNLAIVVDPGFERDVTFASTFVPAVDLLRSTYQIDWWVAPGDTSHLTEKERKKDSNGESDEAAYTFEERRVVQLPRDSRELTERDVVWAVGRWGGLADRAVRDALTLSTAPTLRATTPRLSAQLRGMVLWGDLCVPTIATSNEQGHPTDDRVPRGGCPEYAGITGLRWYDVVYCQTDWDHRFLDRLGFDGAVSNNLQQAWGVDRHGLLPDVGREEDGEANDSSASYDALIVGTDGQIPAMLDAVRMPGLDRVALAVVVSPGDDMIAGRHGFSDMLAAAGIDAGTDAAHLDISDLPPRLSLFVVEPDARSGFTPRAVEVLLIRNPDDTGALAQMAEVAANVVIVATGQLAVWTILVTAVNSHKISPAKVHVVDDDGVRTDRATSLVAQWPEEWGALRYSRRLIAGVTRAFCLGKGSSRISMVRPAERSMTLRGVTDTVSVEVFVEDFHVGRDGEWCITTNGHTLLCVHQPRFAVDLRITSSFNNETASNGSLATATLGNPGDKGAAGNGTTAARGRGFLRLELFAELRSNMYGDVLHRSEPAWLFVDPTQARAYGEDGCSFENTGGIIVCTPTPPIRHKDASSDMLVSWNDPFKTSIDVPDFLQTGTIVALDVDMLSSNCEDDAIC